MPHSSIDATTPNSSRLMFHSFRMPEVAKLMARTSKPSSALSITVMMHSDDLQPCHRRRCEQAARIVVRHRWHSPDTPCSIFGAPRE